MTPDSRKLLWIVVSIIVVGGICYGIGWWQGRVALTEARGQYESRITELQQQTVGLSAQLTEARQRALLMGARSDLYRAAADLDDRNFGLAEQSVNGAAKALAQVEELGPVSPELRSLREKLAGTDLTVAENLESQRATLLGLAGELDSAMGAATAK